jgi:hypothetical protein
MRNVEDSQFGDALRMKQSRAPSDGRAPIVPGKENSLLAELISDGDDVGDQFRESVRSNAGWFTAEVVPALIGHDDAKAGIGQRFDLLAPAIPEFWKAVKKQDDRAVARARGNGVEFHAGIFKLLSFQARFSCERV